MVDPHFNVVAHVDAMSALSGLELDADSRAAFIANLTRLHQFARLMAVAPRITAGGLSVGVQVLAARWQEARVIQALAALEAAGFCNRPARWPLRGVGVPA